MIFLSIDRTKPFDPTEFIGQGLKIWRGPIDGNGLEGEEDQDKRSLALTELDLDWVMLEAHLKESETRTTGEERIVRLNAANRIKLDAKILQTLWENRDGLPDRFKQKINYRFACIFCDGTTFRNSNGDRCTMCFSWDASNMEWHRGYYLLSGDRGVSDPSACLAI